METILEWHSPEHHFDKKGNDWYWILGVIVLGASVLAFYFGNFLFGFGSADRDENLKYGHFVTIELLSGFIGEVEFLQ